MKTIAVVLIIMALPLWLFAQVDKPVQSSGSSGNLNFSIKKEVNTDTKSSGKLQFNITTVKTEEKTEAAKEEIIAKDVTPPFININQPVIKVGFKTQVEGKTLVLSGKVEDESGIFEVMVNDIEAAVAIDGSFQATIPLAYGDNEIVIKATDIKMNVGSKTFVVERKAAEFTPATAVTAEKPDVNKMIVWYAPIKPGTATDKEVFNAKACIKTDLTIQSVVLYQNGWEVFRKDFNESERKIVLYQDAEKRDSCTFYLNEKIVLQGGENILKIDVLADGVTYSREVNISYNMITSNYHALIIGVQDYNDPAIRDLDEPIGDAQKVYDVLVNFYTFEPENITFLKNPTKADIIGTLHKMRSTISENDNLLIFYAGHGYWDADMNNGYWLPSDANQDNPVNWLPNTDLTNYLSVIKSRHTLLITDACFSGGIFKTRNAFNENRAMEQLYKLPSRKAITSGSLNVVPDKSVFLLYLTKRLTENQEQYITAEQLFSGIRMAVINNSPNIPQYGTIQNVGDEGGDFIFIKKK